MEALQLIERVAIRAARAAGRIHLRRLSHTNIERKSNAIDLVTEVDVEVDVDVDGDVLLLEPQPTSAKPSAMVIVAAVKCFINEFSRKLGPAPAPATPE